VVVAGEPLLVVLDRRARDGAARLLCAARNGHEPEGRDD
jgi:hypothetical protein